MAPLMRGRPPVVVAAAAAAAAAAVVGGGAVAVWRQRTAAASGTKRDATKPKPKPKPKKKKKRTRVAVDGRFVRRFVAILRVCVPSWRSVEARLIAGLTVLLFSRTVFSVIIAEVVGENAQAIVETNVPKLLSGLGQFAVVTVPAAAVNALIKFVTNSLNLRFRERLSLHVHREYIRASNVYMAVGLGENRIDNADQRVTADIEDFSRSAAGLYSTIFKPLLDVLLFTTRLVLINGPLLPGMMYGYFAASSVLKKLIMPPIGRMTAMASELEGSYRTAHQRLIANAEEIAFFSGAQKEQHIINQLFGSLDAHLQRLYFLRFTMGVFDGLIVKYWASIVGYLAIMGTFILQPKKATSDFTKDYVRNISYLSSLTVAVGQLVLVGNNFVSLAGYTSRVSELLEMVRKLDRSGLKPFVVVNPDEQQLTTTMVGDDEGQAAATADRTGGAASLASSTSSVGQVSVADAAAAAAAAAREVDDAVEAAAAASSEGEEEEDSDDDDDDDRTRRSGAARGGRGGSDGSAAAMAARPLHAVFPASELRWIHAWRDARDEAKRRLRAAAAGAGESGYKLRVSADLHRQNRAAAAAADARLAAKKKKEKQGDSKRDEEDEADGSAAAAASAAGAGGSLVAATLARHKGGVIEVGDHIEFDDVDIVSPEGRMLAARMNFVVPPGRNVMITGPNGAGKSSLFRIIGELWPLSCGRVVKPHDEDFLFVPQKPYQVLGSLRDQIIYPHSRAAMTAAGVTDDDLARLLTIVDPTSTILTQFKWDDVRDWTAAIGGGQKQRVAMARLFYHKPKFAILDECTSAVTAGIEDKIYKTCTEMGITIFTVSHRASHRVYHEFEVRFDGKGGWQWLPVPEYKGVRTTGGDDDDDDDDDDDVL